MTDLAHYDITMPGDDLLNTEDSLRGLAGFLRTENGEDLTGFPTPADLEDIAARFHRQRVSNRPAIAFCGLPAAGKSLIGEKAADLGDAELLSMGDAIREAAPENIAEESESLAEFAARTREDDSRAIPNWVLDLALDADAGAYVIDGVRSVDDYMVLNNFFENFTLVKVESKFYKRLERITERGREGEDEFDAHDLVDCDAHELEDLGVDELLTYSDDEYLPDNVDYPAGLHDMVMVNNGDDLEELERSVTGLLDVEDQWADRLDINKLGNSAQPDEEIIMGDIEP